jgi:hypothetical protein
MTLLAGYGFQGLKDRNCLRERRARSDFLRWTEIRHRLSTRLNSFHRASQTLLSRCPVRVTNCIAARLTRSDLHCSALSKVRQIAASSSSRRAPTCFLGLASRARQAGSCTQMTATHSAIMRGAIASWSCLYSGVELGECSGGTLGGLSRDGPGLSKGRYPVLARDGRNNREQTGTDMRYWMNNA